MVASLSEWVGGAWRGSARRTSVRLAPWVAMAALACSSCSVGVGTGWVQGEVVDPECGLDDPNFDLEANRFVADPTEDLLEIRVQNGSNSEDASDGLSIYVRSASEVKAQLGEPLPLSNENTSSYRMTLYLNERCPTWPTPALPALFVAVEGEIVFDAIYAPEVDTDAREVHARFEDVRLVDPSQPERRYAVLSGEFSFLFNRGRPAQRFP